MGHYPTMVKRILQSTALTVAFVGILALSSCDSAQRTVYLKDAEAAQTYGVKYDSGLVIQKGDKLGITVSSLRNPELALPFNAKSLTAGGKTLSTLPTPSLPEGVNEPKSPDAQLSYLVDTNGNIQFPVLGSIQVQGMTLDQVSEIIRTRLVAEKYLVDAHVVTKFDNLRVMLLGAFMALTSFNTASNGLTDRGSFHLDNPQTNILELISRVGGLSEQADFERVSVIRRVGNQYAYYRLNMLSKDIFDSPAFYLQQNDIVYAEYKYQKKDDEAKLLSTITYVTSALSTLVTAMALVTILKK